MKYIIHIYNRPSPTPAPRKSISRERSPVVKKYIQDRQEVMLKQFKRAARPPSASYDLVEDAAPENPVKGKMPICHNPPAVSLRELFMNKTCVISSVLKCDVCCRIVYFIVFFIHFIHFIVLKYHCSSLESKFYYFTNFSRL